MIHNSTDVDIILASASPRRKELLMQLGWHPEVAPVDIDESIKRNETATNYCLRMAAEKSTAAQHVLARDAGKNHLPLVTADTIVVLDNVVLGKPSSTADAVLTLIKLSGRQHEVYSAICISVAGQVRTVLSTNLVTMSAISEAQIQAYVDSGEPMDKAGSYGIQGMAAMWIKHISGSYSSIMGLPLYETTTALNELGIMNPLELLINS